MEETPLERLRNLLIYLGINADMIPKSEELHFETLLVALDENPDEQDEFQYIAQIYFVEDILNVPDLERQELELDQLATLQFIVNLPQSFDGLTPERKLVGLELLQLCSQILPAGFMGVNPQGDVFFKYALKSENKDIALAVITDVINMAGFFIHLFTPFIKDVISSEKSLEDLIQGLEQAIGGTLVPN